MYIWEKEIKSVNDWTVFFTDWTSEVYSKEYATYFSSELPQNEVDFIDNKTNKVTSDIIKLFIDSNLTILNIETVIDAVISNVNRNHAKATAFKLNALIDWVPKSVNYRTINSIIMDNWLNDQLKK